MKKEEFAQRIIMLRGAMGLTQEAFAEKVGVSKRSISAWENGDIIPKKTARIKTAVSCGLPVNELLLDEEMAAGSVTTETIPSKTNEEQFLFHVVKAIEKANN